MYATLRLFALVLLISFSWTMQPARADRLGDALQTLLDGFVRSQRLPGAVLTVTGPGIDANLASGRQTSIVTRFYIASAGKIATAAAVLQLVDEGRIRLDQRVSEILAPAGRLARIPNWNDVSIEQLLNHSSGMPDYFTEQFETDAARDRRLLVDVETALQGLATEPATGAAGRAYEYSNTNFALLGLVLQRMDGGSLEASLSRRVFDRAGMVNSQVGADPSTPSIASAHGRRGPSSARANLIAYASLLGDGPLTTTAEDMGRFMLALFRDGRMLEASTLRRMLAPSRREVEYGLGIERSNTRWGMAYGHSGYVTGFNSDAWYYADRQTAIVFITNGDYRDDDTANMVEQVANLVFSGAAAAPQAGRGRVVARASQGQPGPATGLCVMGARVEVLSEGEWYPARVIGAPVSRQRCPIHYEGYGEDEDEMVLPQRMRRPL